MRVILNVEVLEGLKKERGFEFQRLVEFEDWCDQVQPLLAFNPQYEARFGRAKTSAGVSFRMGYANDAQTSIDECIGIVNQAIIAAKMSEEKVRDNNDKQTPEEVEVELPKKITVPWLAKNVEYKVWISLFTLIITVFLAGVKIGSSKFYLTHFSSKASQSTPTSVSPKNL
ncbi:hypothetical protein K6Q96_11250 [Grimontia kaedaensis]|uniref:Uncharacterized protein n=1 Tax=Grimontia kaedaensis TaxID=2872157 RepID=A0ABY4WSY5_9GAMM|nr:hypothetical protein [Grimontia kaedaensis]USH01476.1 hypothetical protein K6Q96_11250 [Grimontia kaedaensis]